MKIRTLKANEIDTRVQMIKDDGSGCSLLLYKDARADMRVLDETFGIMGWKRKHEVMDGNLYCTVSIYNKETKEWIDKQDVGVESYSAKEKGQASDSFKRACVNIGIGRELYTPIFIWINLTKDETYVFKGKRALQKSLKLKVSEVDYSEDKEITRLVIKDNNEKQRYSFGKAKIVKPVATKTPTETISTIDKNKVDTLNKLIEETETNVNDLLGYYKVSKIADLTLDRWTHAMNRLKKKQDKESKDN